MAYCDYTHCDLCDCKAFYDAEIDWEYASVGSMKVLCKNCAKTHELKILELPKPAAPGKEADHEQD